MELVKHVWTSGESKDKNFVFSPFSINAALSLLASGSSGQTLQQLLNYLKSENLDHLNSVYFRIINSLDKKKIGSERGGPQLSFVNGISVESSCTLQPYFKEIANSIYKAEVESVDFKTKAEEIRKAINKWVEDHTNGLIRNLLPQGSIDEDTRLVLANALYFKGSWEQGFDRSKTKNSKFYLLPGKTSSVKVPFMTKNRSRQYVSCFEGFKILQLPYKQAHKKRKKSGEKHLSMYIILPDRRDGLPDLIEKVTSDSAGFLDRHLRVPQRRIPIGKFKIPKFKISFDFKPKEVLKKLGLELPFNPNEAELTEMVSGIDGNLFVSDVFHKCFVEVDEEGTEAAAATAVVGASWSLGRIRPPPPPEDFVANHPFMFVIIDNHSKVVLFMGHVLNPLLN